MKRYRVVSEYATIIKDVFTKTQHLPLRVNVGEFIPEEECIASMLEYSLTRGFLKFAISQGWVVVVDEEPKREDVSSSPGSEKSDTEETPKEGVFSVSEGEKTTVVEVVPGGYVVSNRRVSLENLDKLNSFQQRELVNMSTDIGFLEEIANRTKYKTVQTAARDKISELMRR